MAGWIKIHREISEHWIFQDAEKFKWWIDMLFLASYEDNRALVKNQVIEFKRWQFIGSLSFFTKRWGVSKDRVINFLKILQSNGMIDKKSDKNITLVTICNYESYQDVPDNLSDNLSDNKLDNKVDNLPDNLPDTTKEVKEGKEINNKSNSAYTREEKVSWNASTEQGFCERFKAQGYGMKVARVTGLKADEILTLLDIFSAKCEVRNQGHKDFDHFNNRFLWAIQNKWIQLPEVPKEKKTGKNILEAYGLL